MNDLLTTGAQPAGRHR